MAIRQPDVCFCFGGRCWRQFCPDRAQNKKKAKDTQYERPKGRKRTHPEVRTLSQSLKEMNKDKADE